MSGPAFFAVEPPARIPPHSYDTEQQLLGALLMDNRQLESIGQALHPDHFAEPSHGRIFEVITRLVAAGRRADPVTLQTILATDPGLAELGGPAAYLVGLVGSVVSTRNTPDYARTVVDLAQRREMMTLADEIADRAASVDIDTRAADLAHEFEARLFSLTERVDGGAGSRAFAEIMPAMLRQSEEAMQRGGGLIGLATGLGDLDELIGGMAPGNSLVLGARPAMGKSALMCGIAAHVARAQAPVGVFSLEMRGEEIGQRIAADATGIPYTAVRNGRLDHDEWAKVRQAERELAALPLHIDDTPGLHIDQIRVRGRRMVRRHGVGLIAIDHLHLVRGPGKDRLAELTKISASLKEMARELGIPILALCQLSRALESRDDKRPQLSDLRESGSIEQDADIVAFLHRAFYYTEKAEPQRKTGEKDATFTGRLADWHAKMAAERNRADVLVHKNRHGRTGAASLFCDLALSRFRSLAPSQMDGGW
jgi:replicative DNA helicase